LRFGRGSAHGGLVTPDSARKAALDVLTAALGRKAGLEAALDGPSLAALAPKDRAFARAAVMSTLRHLGPIDRALEAKLKRPPPEAVKMILRLGAAQLFWLQTPAYAAVSSSVALAGSVAGARAFKGLINAVLRGLERDGPPAYRPSELAPAWLFARWRAAYGEADAQRICALIEQEPATDLTPKDTADAPVLAEALQAIALPGGSLRRVARGRVEEWPGFADGRWWVQDAAAAIPARLAGVRPGEDALDLCAAPGGKALQLAAAGARLVALDRSSARLQRLTDALSRARLQAEVVAADAVCWDDPRRFDVALLDAPCTSSGVFRRNPDVLWTLKPSDVAGVADIQTRLLDAAAARLRPGGRLIYCVCSLEPEEGEAQARAFLRRHADFATHPIQLGEGGAPHASVTNEGWLRVLPHHLEGGLDGFFIARFSRSGDVLAGARVSS
jgi:16S rRNA (cytosine967-C5)-methyltransferase